MSTISACNPNNRLRSVHNSAARLFSHCVAANPPYSSASLSLSLSLFHAHIHAHTRSRMYIDVSGFGTAQSLRYATLYDTGTGRRWAQSLISARRVEFAVAVRVREYRTRALTLQRKRIVRIRQSVVICVSLVKERKKEEQVLSKSHNNYNQIKARSISVS